MRDRGPERGLAARLRLELGVRDRQTRGGLAHTKRHQPRHRDRWRGYYADAPHEE